MATSSISRLTRAALLIAAVVVLAAGSASAQSTSSGRGKLDALLGARARQFSGRSQVIVEYSGVADVRAISGARGIAGRVLANQRLQVATVDNQQLETLAADPRILTVTLDRDTFPTLERTGVTIGATLASATYGVTGKGIGVAIIDSGISHINKDLYRDPDGAVSPVVVHFKDFTASVPWPAWAPQIPDDDYGHGTHVAGIVAGSGWASSGRRRGIAPDANLIGLRVLDREGRGHISDVIDAIDYAISIKRLYNLRVINLSVAAAVTSSYKDDPLTLAAKRAVDAGIVVVAAAGNQGLCPQGTQWGGITAPGNAPWVLTVGAESHNGTKFRSDDKLAGFSSRGPTWIDFAAKPDLIAPGVGIESLTDPSTTLYHQLPQFLLDGTRNTGYKPYLSLSGTSMAAPVVTAAVALMLEANPKLTPNAVKAILEYTAQDNPAVSPLEEGAGLINVPGAIRMARFFRHPQGGLVGEHADLIEGERIPWSEQLIWGNFRITGGVPLPHSNAWALSTRWGVIKTATGQPVVWGARDTDNIVWSTARPNDDDNIVWSTAAPSNDDNIVWSTAARTGGGDDNIVWSTGGVDRDNIVWSTMAPDSDNIVWSTMALDSDNIVWSTRAPDADNIVWSTAYAQNVVWGRDCGGRNCLRIVWGAKKFGRVYGTAAESDNIVWSTAILDNDNIVWSTAASGDSDNIVWSTASPGDDDNIVWSTSMPRDDDNIVWSTSVPVPTLWPH